jgi:anthranilate synthase component 1
VTDGALVPDRAAFAALAAAHPVVPVTRRLLADGATPVGVYRTLAGGPGTFLLESAEHGGAWSRYSFVGVRSAAMLTEEGGEAVWRGDAPPGVPTSGDPLDVLRVTAAALRAPRLEGLPPLAGGLVGYLAYDVVRRLERLPSLAVDDLRLPELGLLLATDLAVLDHVDGSVLLVANAFTGAAGDPVDPDAAYDHAVRRLDAMSAGLADPAPSPVSVLRRGPAPAARSNRTPEDFRAAVEAVKEEIRAGEAFQVVVSQRFEADADGVDGLDVYRVLRASNPSPYMYLVRLPDPAAEGGTGLGTGGGATIDIVGSSPETLVKVTGGRAVVHPIAGTRPRGATPEEDAALASELLADPKERSEHVMLVDLGRNDLGRVCRPGSVDVVDFMRIERYSHVMHIVSTVVGELSEGREAVDVLTACFPAGTLSGAPKPRAMEIVEKFEPTRRGVYGGTVGYLDFAGDLDMAIAIRTAVLRGGRAYVQAGAGLVADSVPHLEEAETRHKAAAVLAALEAARSLRPAEPAGG